jgi:hypothetical protein
MLSGVADPLWFQCASGSSILLQCPSSFRLFISTVCCPSQIFPIYKSDIKSCISFTLAHKSGSKNNKRKLWIKKCSDQNSHPFIPCWETLRRFYYVLCIYAFLLVICTVRQCTCYEICIYRNNYVIVNKECIDSKLWSFYGKRLFFLFVFLTKFWFSKIFAMTEFAQTVFFLLRVVWKIKCLCSFWSH